MRRQLLGPLAALLGAAVVVLPAAAGSETTPSVQAVNRGIYYHYWSPALLTVSTEGDVTFSNPYTETAHGLKFTRPAVPGAYAPAAAGTHSAGSTPGSIAPASGGK